MGIGSDLIELLIKLRTAGYLRDNSAVMEIGAQQLANSFLTAGARITDLGRLFGIDAPLSLPTPTPSHIVHGNLEHLDSNAPFARDFWRWLGFDYAAIDVDGSEGSIPLDLNYDATPPEAKGKYDFVTNFGTTEHVANQLNAFEVIHDLTSLGGLMAHALPAQGMLNHGLFNYNFKFFWMLARSNEYRFLHANFIQSSESYQLPSYMTEWIHSNSLAPELGPVDAKVADAFIVVVLQKTFDIPFVAPIDVPTGTRTEVEKLKKRYWTVFEPDAFAGLKRFQPGG
jgi:hypothetical protein